MTATQTTLFGFLPGKLAHYVFDTQKPVLNDNLGDVLYATAEDAERFGRFICSTPEAKHKRVAIMSVRVDAEVFNEIVSAGEVMEGPVNVLGFSGMLLNPRACEKLNKNASFQFEEIVLEADETDSTPAIPRHLLN